MPQPNRTAATVTHAVTNTRLVPTSTLGLPRDAPPALLALALELELEPVEVGATPPVAPSVASNSLNPLD